MSARSLENFWSKIQFFKFFVEYLKLKRFFCANSSVQVAFSENRPKCLLPTTGQRRGIPKRLKLPIDAVTTAYHAVTIDRQGGIPRGPNRSSRRHPILRLKFSVDLLEKVQFCLCSRHPSSTNIYEASHKKRLKPLDRHSPRHPLKGRSFALILTSFRFEFNWNTFPAVLCNNFSAELCNIFGRTLLGQTLQNFCCSFYFKNWGICPGFSHTQSVPLWEFQAGTLVEW